jgi:hypothetical protein
MRNGYRRVNVHGLTRRVFVGLSLIVVESRFSLCGTTL